MVAESVKAYPMSSYPALIPLASPVNSLQAYSCSNSLLQNSYASGLSPQKQLPREEFLPHIPETPSGLSASGLSISGLEVSNPLRKKDLMSQRKQREFIPDAKKDDSYWDRRRRNNEAAKRSREKRRFNDMILEQRVIELSKENHVLKAQLKAINEKYGIQSEGLVNVDQVMSSMPQSDQIIALNKRTKLSQALLSLRNSPSVTSILSPSGMCSSSSQQYQESSPGSPHSHYGYGSQDRSESPDMYRNDHMDVDNSREESISEDHDSPQSSKDYSSIESQYYEQTALNLSSRSHTSPRLSTSPSFAPVEYTNEPDMSRESPILADSGSCLPLKLRHKTHLGEKDAAHSLLALQGIKSEPRESFAEHDDSDDRDSGLNTSSASSPSNVYNNPPSYDQNPRNEDLELENEQLRTQIEYLASEVATIKCILGGKRTTQSEIDSDGSR